jgi:dienelactone hydrolase
MRNNKIDWQLIKYGGAVHSFTDKTAGNDNSKGAAYNKEADVRSWQAMKDFFKEVL